MAIVRGDGWGGMRSEAIYGVWRLGRTGYGGSGGGHDRGQTGLTASFRQSAPKIHVSLVCPRGLRNEPNFRVFRLGRIRYGGVHFGLVLAAETLAAFQFREVGEEGSLGFDDVTMEAMEGVGIGGEAGGEIGAPFGFVGDGGAVVDEVGGEEAVAAQEPVVFDEDVDEKAFDDADGLKLVVVLVGESGENGGVFAGGGFVSGVDAGFESVHARDGFTLFGARTGGELCIRAIGENLLLGCHRASSHDGSRRAGAFSVGLAARVFGEQIALLRNFAARQQCKCSIHWV